MKRNFTKTLVAIILLRSSALLAQTAIAPSAGDGSSGSPYEIATWQNLYWISLNSAHWDKYYIQTANIDFADAVPAIATWDGGKGWPPIADFAIPFTGNYNGLDHTISNLTINRPSEEDVALFGSASSSASINNVGLVGGSVIGKNYVGSLVGYNNGAIGNAYATSSVSCNNHTAGGLVGFNRGAISNAYATGSVLFENDLGGGLVGDNRGTISNAHASGPVTGKYWVGGLVGWNLGGGTISDSYATGDVTGVNNAGGLVGEQQTGSITDSYATGNVTGNSAGGLVGTMWLGHVSDVQAMGNVSGNHTIGGLVGSINEGSITKACAMGSVIGNNDYVGGLVGTCEYLSSITEACATGDVTGGKYVGGLVGYNEEGNINNCYAAGSVSGKDYVGGFAGENNESIINSYSRGNVTRNSGALSSFGGFVGLHLEGSITNSYSTGWVKYTGSNPEIQTNKGFAGGAGATITNSFWDKETSGASTSAGTATGKTTAEMKTQATFTDAGWDFIGESTNGVNDYWDIFSYDGYPFFTWQYYLPTVTTQSVSDVLETTATGNGNITDLGCPYPSQHGVCWNTSGTPTIADNKTEEGSSSATGAFTSNITGLSTNTQYYVRAYITNSEGTTYGDQTDFTTLEFPVLTTDEIEGIDENSAISGGNVISGDVVTERGVCWSTNPNPTIADSRTSDGSGLGSFVSNITGLNKNTKYYVRAYAVNSDGIGYGDEKSFITPNQLYNMLDFDGANDYVTVPITLPEQGTIEFWFYADDNTTGFLWSGAATHWYSQVLNNGQIYTWIGGQTGSAIIASGISANKWYHFAVTWVKVFVSVTSQVYLNGNLIGTTSNQWDSPGTTMTIGKKTTHFNGKIEEFKIWNTVRAPTNLRTDMHKFISPSSSNLLCYYNFDSSSGSTVTDGTSNGYNGKLINMTNANWVTSTAPAGVYGTYVRTTAKTTAGETGKTISATISTGGDDTNYLGIYSYGEGDASIYYETFPTGVCKRSNIVWGVVEFGSVTSDITFDYSNISGLGVESKFKLLKRTNAISGWTDITGSAIQNTSDHTFTLTGVTSFSEYTVAEHEIFTDDFAGNALDFNGSNAYINVGNGASFDLGNVLTIEAWVKPGIKTGRQGIFSTRSSNIAGSFQLEIGTASGGAHRVAVSGVNTWVAQTGDNVYNDGEWVHLAYVRTVSGAGTHTIYIDGVAQSLISDDSYEFINNTNDKVIGQGTSGTQFFKGVMDEVRVWNVARTNQQIRENMHRTLSGYEDGLVSYYQFNEGSGTTTADNVSLNNGTLLSMDYDDWVVSTAPLPFISNTDGLWNNAANWLDGQGYPVNAWSRAEINSNIILEDNLELIDLSINNGTSLTVNAGAGLTITGNLVNNGGTGGLIMESNASHTGSLIHHNTGVEASFERTITDADWNDWKDGWHFLSSPVAAQAIDPAFTATPATDYDFYAWYEPTNQWVNFKNTSENPTWNTVNGDNNFTPGKGYMAAYNNGGTKQFTGELNVADVSVSGLTITGAEANRSWHLLGNPFGSALSWDASSEWDLNNIAGVAKIWDESNQSYADVSSSPAGIIPATNGFMVRVSDGTGSLTLPAQKRVHSVQPFYKSSIVGLELKAISLSEGNAQVCRIAINPEATEKFDLMLDGEFLKGHAPAFYAIADNKWLSTNALPEIREQSEVFFGFEKNSGHDFRIEVSGMETLPTGAFLHDLKNDIVTDLAKEPAYYFTSSEGDAPIRFKLKFSGDGNGTRPPVRAYFTKNILHLLNTEGEVMVEVFSLTGQRLAEVKTRDTAIGINLVTGIYLVRITSQQEVISVKLFNY